MAHKPCRPRFASHAAAAIYATTMNALMPDFRFTPPVFISAASLDSVAAAFDADISAHVSRYHYQSLLPYLRDAAARAVISSAISFHDIIRELHYARRLLLRQTPRLLYDTFFLRFFTSRC